MPAEDNATLTVRVSGTLRQFVADRVSSSGDYENVSEYLRALIRSDKTQSEERAFERLKAELAHAWAAPESSYLPLTADDIVQRNRD